MQVPDSGHPDDFNLDPSGDMESVDVDDEGELWSHKLVHGFRWYKVRMLRRANSNEASARYFAYASSLTLRQRIEFVESLGSCVKSYRSTLTPPVNPEPNQVLFLCTRMRSHFMFN